MKTLKNIIYIGFIVALVACKKDKTEVTEPTPVNVNEEELITTVTLHFYEEGNSSYYFMASFRDVDGVGGNEATIDTIKLDTNSTYNVSVELLDESKSTTENITEEVKEEADEHLFCYESTTSNLAVNITDTDGTFPIGIDSDWKTTDEIISSIKIILKHQPEGQKNGSCSPGETDVEVEFPLVIK